MQHDASPTSTECNTEDLFFSYLRDNNVDFLFISHSHSDLKSSATFVIFHVVDFQLHLATVSVEWE